MLRSKWKFRNIFQISQDSVATYCRWGGNLYGAYISHWKFFYKSIGKKCWKSIYICQSYYQTSRGILLLRHTVICHLWFAVQRLPLTSGGYTTLTGVNCTLSYLAWPVMTTSSSSCFTLQRHVCHARLLFIELFSLAMSSSLHNLNFLWWRDALTQ